MPCLQKRDGTLSISIAFALLVSASAAAENPAPQASRSRYASPSAVKAWLRGSTPVVFLDVREADEFAAGHIPEAINVAHDQVATLVGQLPYDQPIVIYCIHSAHRAPQAAKTLESLGFTNVYVLEGGLVAWQAEGLTIRASHSASAPTILPKTERCDPKATL